MAAGPLLVGTVLVLLVPARGDTVPFTVSGTTQGWQNTGFTVNAPGDVIWIEANGTIWFANRGTADTDPNGFGSEKDGTGFAGYESSIVFGSLIGQIDGTLVPEGDSPHIAQPGQGFVGTEYTEVMPDAGTLSLAYNDGGVTDNSGSFDVTISDEFSVFGLVDGETTFQWQDTGLDIEAGQFLSIVAEGTIAYNDLTGTETDPDGFGDKDGTGFAGQYPSIIFGSLIGKIGDTLVPEGDSPYAPAPGTGFVGSNYSEQMISSGRLYLAYNDAGVLDNDGAFTVSINVQPIPEPGSAALLGLLGLTVLFRRNQRARG